MMPGTPMPAVMLTNIWAMTPFFFLLLSAALAAIPNEVIESARIDRAGTWGMIFRIKLPFLRNALLVASLLMVIANFNDFAKIWAMTQGGPGYSTTTLVIYVYRQAFENFAFGYASALGDEFGYSLGGGHLNGNDSIAGYRLGPRPGLSLGGGHEIG